MCQDFRHLKTVAVMEHVKRLFCEPEVRCKARDHRNQSFERTINLNAPRYSERVLRLGTKCPPRCTLLSEVGNGWNMGRSGRSMTWESSKTLANGLSRFGQAKLLSWDLRDHLKRWLEIVDVTN